MIHHPWIRVSSETEEMISESRVGDFVQGTWLLMVLILQQNLVIIEFYVLEPHRNDNVLPVGIDAYLSQAWTDDRLEIGQMMHIMSYLDLPV